MTNQQHLIVLQHQQQPQQYPSSSFLNRFGLQDSSTTPSDAVTTEDDEEESPADSSSYQEPPSQIIAKPKNTLSGNASSKSGMHTTVSSISSNSASYESSAYRSGKASGTATTATNSLTAGGGTMTTPMNSMTSSILQQHVPTFQTTLECDYDVNPTELYQAIETKQWDSVIQYFDDNPELAQKQAATWVTRKEMNGKLRWRLLPIHAAVIFQATPPTVERLLQECPGAAQAKDDQGMLPLHLAFRTKITCWETVEELLTAHPNAIFVRDRKGRTPIQCGIAASTAALTQTNSAKPQESSSTQVTGTDNTISTAITSVPSLTTNTTSLLLGGTAASILTSPGSTPTNGQTSNNAEHLQQQPLHPQQQKAIFSVLELYTQISVSDNVQRAIASSRTQAENRLGSVQESHIQTLTKLRDDWEKQKNDMAKKIITYRQDILSLQEEMQRQQHILEEKQQTEHELVQKLQEVTNALEIKTKEVHNTVVIGNNYRDGNHKRLHDDDTIDQEVLDDAIKKQEQLQKANQELLKLLQALLHEQTFLKTSIDNMQKETNQLKIEREMLLNQYLSAHDKESEITDQYTKECQEKLMTSNIAISKQLNKILTSNSFEAMVGSPGRNSTSKGQGGRRSATTTAPLEDMEEKKIEADTTNNNRTSGPSGAERRNDAYKNNSVVSDGSDATGPAPASHNTASTGSRGLTVVETRSSNSSSQGLEPSGRSFSSGRGGERRLQQQITTKNTTNANVAARSKSTGHMHNNHDYSNHVTARYPYSTKRDGRGGDKVVGNSNNNNTNNVDQSRNNNNTNPPRSNPSNTNNNASNNNNPRNASPWRPSDLSPETIIKNR